MEQQEKGAIRTFDNQSGDRPKPCQPNQPVIAMQRYATLQDCPNGIYEITREAYIAFNHGHGIFMKSIKYPGDIYALKYDGTYMFLLKNADRLYLLEGGRRHKLHYDMGYYFENLPVYVQRVRSAFAPYQHALSLLSDEVKTIGGTGDVHGCIVDIDWFNHIYLNPFDGKIIPYFADDMTNKLMFKSIKSLLRSSPVPPQLSNGTPMLAYYKTMAKAGNLPILSHNTHKGWGLAVVPQLVLDRSMYGPSRIMRSIQYIFDQNVLRVWNDEVLSFKGNASQQGQITGAHAGNEQLKPR